MTAAVRWTPEQFWEYAEGLIDAFVRDQLRETMAERGLCLRTAAPAEQEPVAWRYRHSSHREWTYHDSKPSGPSIHLFEVEPLYATPPAPSDAPGDAAQGRVVTVNSAEELAAVLAGEESGDCAVLPSGAVVYGEPAEVIHTLEAIIERWSPPSSDAGTGEAPAFGSAAYECSVVDGGLQLLLAAVHADDPKREILVRVGDLMRDTKRLARALNEPQTPVAYQRRNIGPDGKPWSTWLPANDKPTPENMAWDGVYSYEYRPLYAGAPLPRPHQPGES